MRCREMSRRPGLSQALLQDPETLIKSLCPWGPPPALCGGAESARVSGLWEVKAIMRQADPAQGRPREGATPRARAASLQCFGLSRSQRSLEPNLVKA